MLVCPQPAADQADSTDGKRLRQAAPCASSSPSTDTRYDAQTSVEQKQDTANRSHRSQTAVSDSEVTSPEGPYIQGTHLVAGGWFQTCR
jgi:hypothetical protein